MSGAPLADIGPVTDAPGVAEMIEQAREVHVAPAIRRYIVDIVEATRQPRRHLPRRQSARLPHDYARVRAFAAAQERDYVIPTT